MTYANGHTMKTVYNSIGQMVAEKWFETEADAASSTATPNAHYKYVYDGDGNIVRSIDISGKKEYNYEYEEGRIVRATEADIELFNESVTSTVMQRGRISLPLTTVSPSPMMLRATQLNTSVTL